MPAKIGLSIIVVTYNSEQYIQPFLESLTKSIKSNDEVIVIDNKSTDRTVKLVKKYHSKLKLISNRSNFGFANAVNLGINITSGSHVLLLNPDTWVTKDAITVLFKCLTHEGAGIAGGKNLKPNGEIHETFVRRPTIGTIIFDFTNFRKLVIGDYFHKQHYYSNQRFPVKNKSVDAISGSFMLFDRKIIDKIGYFDENFFMYLEDVDFCVRAKSKGVKVIFCPHSKIMHIGGASSKNEDKINRTAWYSSRSYYTKKHFPRHINLLAQRIFKLDELITNIWLRIK